MNLRFDDGIDLILRQIQVRFPTGAPKETTIIRDALGVLTVALPDGAVDHAGLVLLAQGLHDQLGRFSPGVDEVVLEQSDLIDRDDIIESEDRVLFPNARGVGLVDRLLTNQDWLREPRTHRPPAATAVFYSVKGGVGRSTAMVALAKHLASLGKRVMVVDLDLEAPGIGSMMLTHPPDYGVVDWCVESITDGADQELFDGMVAPSPIADGGPGAIVVVPAFGRRTKNYPVKLGRVSIPSLETGTMEPLGLADRVLSLLEFASKSVPAPDVVLLDSRSGIHDIGAAAVTQLGAEVFLFFRADAQNRSSYATLFEHLRLARSVKPGMPSDDLRRRFHMVAAQIDASNGGFCSALRDSYEMWGRLYEDESGSVEFAMDDETAPHFPLCTVYDTRVRGTDFVGSGREPSDEVLKEVFGAFVEGVARRLLGAC